MKTHEPLHRDWGVSVTLALTLFAAWGASAASTRPESFLVFRADAPLTPPPTRTIIGAVSNHICGRPWDVRVSDEQAIEALKAKSRDLGANGLIDVRLDRHRSDLKAPCWNSVRVSGTAVILPMP